VKSKLVIHAEGLFVAGALALYALGLIAFPIIALFLLGWLSLRVRRLRWRDVGLRAPSAMFLPLLICATAAVAYQAADIYVLVPMIQRLTGESLDLTMFSTLRGNVQGFVGSLVVSWSLAAFVEELFFRGYLFNRLSQALGTGAIATVGGLAASALVFGCAHAYQGATGVVNNLVFGFVLGGLYLAGKKNLWFPILTHGIVDTIGFLLIFVGLYP
jgi:hypothetical protein